MDRTPFDILDAFPKTEMDSLKEDTESIPLKLNSQPSNRPATDWIPLDRYKLFRIIQAMVDAVLVFDKNQNVRLCNRSFERIFDVTQSDIFGQHLPDLFLETAPHLADDLAKVLETGKPDSKEVFFVHNHRRKVFLLSTIPIEENGVVSEGVAVLRDITMQKQIERMRRDFVANVSHELRTPLSAINGYAETLIEGALEDPAVAMDFIQIIFNHSQRLSHLVRDLLDLSKLESSDTPPPLEPVNLIALIEKVVRLNEKTLRERQVKLHTVLPLEFSEVMAIESHIEQVLMNLLDNAIKYTPEQGAISIRVVQAGPDNDTVRIEVEDTGMGIEAKHISRLFERFYRVDKARSRDLGGTGLGLSIVKHIIQNHGGDVWVESIPGQGTTFSFTLKAVQI